MGNGLHFIIITPSYSAFGKNKTENFKNIHTKIFMNKGFRLFFKEVKIVGSFWDYQQQILVF